MRSIVTIAALGELVSTVLNFLHSVPFITD